MRSYLFVCDSDVIGIALPVDLQWCLIHDKTAFLVIRDNTQVLRLSGLLFNLPLLVALSGIIIIILM